MQLNNTIIELITELTRLMRTGISYQGGIKHLTFHQLQTLIFVAKQKDVCMVEVAKNFNITKPTATVLINALVKNGYLRKTRDKEDKRKVKVTLADKGQKMLIQAVKIKTAKINHILSYISNKDKKQLAKVLQIIAQKLKEENKDEK